MNTPVLQAQQLTRRFGGLTAVAGVDLSLALHEIHAVIGTNGAGKSTLINMLSCELPPTSGRLFLKGEEVTGWSQPRLARHGVGRSYQRNNIFLPLTVRPALARHLGTRHRAGLGVTEETDCLSLIVSEETGRISVAAFGEIELDVSPERLEHRIHEHLISRRAIAPARSPARADLHFEREAARDSNSD